MTDLLIKLEPTLQKTRLLNIFFYFILQNQMYTTYLVRYTYLNL